MANSQGSLMHVSDPLLEQGSLLELSPSEELLLIEAQQEILDGEYYTQEEVEKMVEDWESADYRKQQSYWTPRTKMNCSTSERR
ncbi:MAG: hypothetical protein U0176_02720 [Bacteroidia bacterium]